MKTFQIFLLLLFSISVKAQTVYKTPSGAKYHVATCRMVTNVSEKMDLNAAVEKGLSACKICKPPTSSRSTLYQTKSAQGESQTVQCRGKTNAGTRCKHKTSIANGFCFQHNPAK